MTDVQVDDQFIRAWDANARIRISELKEHRDSAYTDLSSILISQLKNHTPPIHSVLDAGCGVGALTNLLHETGFAAIGIDPSEASIHQARQAWPESSFAVARVEQMPTERIFDAVVANMVLHTTTSLDSFCQATSAVLADHGVFLATIPHPAFYLFAKEPSLNPEYSHEQRFLITFRINGSEAHPRKVPYVQRTIQMYTDALYRAGFHEIRITEPPQVGVGRPHDVLLLQGLL